ncbi:hypothetical protein BGZ80_011413 [Entomortierella chlamydospora]|uniref:Uncharacterized protein n=1 Tax=Entomortierella chlamydospora TaxID=101097 RepID=A0A9P6MUH2_9FUNG|nr:hypothetical protein BGZ80_011413 [Entomortierella chlamydospora]
MQRRFKTYKSAYNDACRIKKRTGSGVTDEDIARGNNTIEEVLEWKCYGFKRMKELYEKHSSSEPTCAADFSTQGIRILSSGNEQDESHEAEEYEVDEFLEMDELDESYECGDGDDLHQWELPVHTTQSTAQSFSKDAALWTETRSQPRAPSSTVTPLSKTSSYERSSSRKASSPRMSFPVPVVPVIPGKIQKVSFGASLVQASEARAKESRARTTIK